MEKDLGRMEFRGPGEFFSYQGMEKFTISDKKNAGVNKDAGRDGTEKSHK